MANWIDTVSAEDLKHLWSSLGADLITQDLASNPRELSDEEYQSLGLALTVKYQEEKGDGYDHSELVVKYGTPAMLESYRAFTETN